MISIVTPTFNGLDLLKRCRASIADQRGVDVEHIVMDGGSTDGTVAWLQQNDIHHVSQKDAGMYDALNKGWALCKGDILAWLNCDEQYLPDSLALVEQAFASNPDVDILFGDALVVDPAGRLICYRKHIPLRPSWVMAAKHLYLLSCALFFRRRFFDEGHRFDIGFRTAGDHDLVLRLLRAGFRTRHLPAYLATFMMTGGNQSASPRAAKETELLWKATPGWVKALRLPINATRLATKHLHGCYRQSSPITYAVYTDQLDRRESISETRPSWRWPAA